MKRLDESEAMPTSIYSTDEELSAKWDVAGDGDYQPAFLYVDRGPGAGQLVPVKQGATVIGRASVAELRLQHPSISRRHAQVTRVGERFYLKDLGSQNGTFANKTKLATELEIHPGDEIALGNAVVKLRGPATSSSAPLRIPAATEGRPRGTQSAIASRPTPPRKRKAPANALRLAIFAGAVGFGLAAVLMFALLRGEVTEPKRPVPAEKVAVAPAASPRPAKDSAPSADDAKVDQRVKEAMRASKVPDDDEPARELPPAREKAATKPAVREETPKRPAILALYEKGNVAGALTLARKGTDPELVTRLSSFQAAYDAAQGALASKNGTAAIKSFETALRLDGQLSPQGSQYTTELHHQLSELWTLVGFAHLQNEDGDAAEKAFSTAVKHEPGNGKAKAELTRLTGSPTPKAPPKVAEPAPKPTEVAHKPAAAAGGSKIDDAFGDEDASAKAPAAAAPRKAPEPKAAAPARSTEVDEERPPARAAPTKKPADRAAAIDEAFGD